MEDHKQQSGSRPEDGVGIEYDIRRGAKFVQICRLVDPHRPRLESAPAQDFPLERTGTPEHELKEAKLRSQQRIVNL